MGNAIEVRGLTKKFNTLTAVDGIDLTVREGEIFGLLGPNGAGKSTTISILCTLLNPTSGTAKVWGYDVAKHKDEVRKSVGIVFQDPAVDDELTGYENLDFHCRVYDVPAKERKKRIDEMLRLVELTGFRDKLVKTYSGGMRRRLEIARGFLHHPKVLFLDEPTLGLDPQTRNKIWDYIRKLNKRAKITIIITTHYMDEADSLCSRIGIIDRGGIVALGTGDELKEVLGGDVIILSTEEGKKLCSLIKGDWVKGAKCHDGKVMITVERAEEKIPDIIKTADKNDIQVKSVMMKKPSLEDVFLHYTGRSIREENGHQDPVFRKMHGGGRR